jgi:hypothetical protein
MSLKEDRHASLKVRLMDLLNTNFFFLKHLAQLVDQAEFDPLTNAILAISGPANCTLPLLNHIIAGEFEANFRAPSSILRGNCVASKLMGAYSRQFGKDYLKFCVGHLIEEYASKGEEFMVVRISMSLNRYS